MAQEAYTHSLQAYVEARIPALHPAIKIPDHDQPEYLIHFITQYIDHVPDFLEALIELTKSAGIYDSLQHLIEIAQSYFLNPPELVKQHVGLHALIDEAYLAHRLMEEVNDRMMMSCGLPLIPMDMTLSNLVVHNLLGDDFANQLDLTVHYSVESLFEQHHMDNSLRLKNYLSLHKTEGWDEMLAEWPCLAGDLSIELNLDYRPEPGALH